MPIYFRNTPVTEPFTFDSIGNNWIQDEMNRPKGYPKYHYLQTEKGRGILTIQGKKYTLNPHEGLLIAPFIPHFYYSPDTNWQTTFITFTGTIENSISQLLDNRQIIFVEKELGVQLGAIISQMVKNYEAHPEDSLSISMDCYRILMHLSNGIHTQDLMKEPLYQRYVAPVIREIERHYDQNLTVQTLSRQVYITPQYLSRLFQKFLGCSTYEYLTTYRINKAKEYLMLHQRMEVQEIAGKTGFLDTSHFIAMFRRQTGVTPLEFRKIN